MRSILTGLAVVLGLGIFAAPSRAQNEGFSDPFFLYYGFYLPRQASLAAQPQPEDNIRFRSAERQVAAVTDRQGLYEPTGSIFETDLDPLSAFGKRSGHSRLPRTTATGIVNSNLTGSGATGYYNRTGSYYPALRSGRSTRSAARGSRGAAVGGSGGRMPSIAGLARGASGLGGGQTPTGGNVGAGLR